VAGSRPDAFHFVILCSCRYVDNLTFVLSTGRVLGGEEHIGGDGGGLKHSLARLQPKFNVTNMHLQGVKGSVVRSQGVTLITNVNFVYRVAADKQMESKEMEVSEPGGPPGLTSAEVSSSDEDSSDLADLF